MLYIDKGVMSGYLGYGAVSFRGIETGNKSKAYCTVP